MLAGIDERTFADVFKRCCPATALPAPLNQLHRQPSLARRCCRRQPSQTTTDNYNLRRLPGLRSWITSGRIWNGRVAGGHRGPLITLARPLASSRHFGGRTRRLKISGPANSTARNSSR